MWRLLLGTMGVKSLVQGLNAAGTAGFEPRTVWSEVRRRNRLATGNAHVFKARPLFDRLVLPYFSHSIYGKENSNRVEFFVTEIGRFCLGKNYKLKENYQDYKKVEYEHANTNLRSKTTYVRSKPCCCVATNPFAGRVRTSLQIRDLKRTSCTHAERSSLVPLWVLCS